MVRIRDVTEHADRTLGNIDRLIRIVEDHGLEMTIDLDGAWGFAKPIKLSIKLGSEPNTDIVESEERHP